MKLSEVLDLYLLTSANEGVNVASPEELPQVLRRAA